jgi:hypothetical protein
MDMLEQVGGDEVPSVLLSTSPIRLLLCFSLPLPSASPPVYPGPRAAHLDLVARRGVAAHGVGNGRDSVRGWE